MKEINIGRSEHLVYILAYHVWTFDHVSERRHTVATPCSYAYGVLYIRSLCRFRWGHNVQEVADEAASSSSAWHGGFTSNIVRMVLLARLEHNVCTTHSSTATLRHHVPRALLLSLVVLSCFQRNDASGSYDKLFQPYRGSIVWSKQHITWLKGSFPRILACETSEFKRDTTLVATTLCHVVIIFVAGRLNGCVLCQWLYFPYDSTQRQTVAIPRQCSTEDGVVYCA